MSNIEKICVCDPNTKASKTEESKGCSCGSNADPKSIEETGFTCASGEKIGSKNETKCACASNGISQRDKLKPVSAPRIYLDRRPVKGEVVTVIDVTFDSSGIDLVDTWSRAVPRGEVHEIMIWSPLEEGDDAAAVAFIEVTQGGNIVNGDEVRLDGKAIGNLVGFDYNHMPNHMNVVVEARSIYLQVKIGSVFEFVQNPILSIVEEKCC